MLIIIKAEVENMPQWKNQGILSYDCLDTHVMLIFFWCVSLLRFFCLVVFLKDLHCT